MSAAEQPECYSIDAYLELLDRSNEKFEFVNGYLRAMTGPTIRHNIIATNVTVLFGMKLKGLKCRAFNANSLTRVRRDSATWMYFPDVSIIRVSNKQSERFQERPEVVVEVLSSSTRAVDLDEKVENYLAIDSLQVYLLLEQDLPKAILYRRTAEGFLRESVEGLDKHIAFPTFGWSLSLAEVYEAVEFPPPSVREPSAEYAAEPLN